MASYESLKWKIPVFPYYQFIKQFDKTDMISYSHVPPNLYFLREKKKKQQKNPSWFRF